MNHLSAFIIIGALVSASTSCTKEWHAPEVAPSYEAPQVNAGPDLFVALPSSTVMIEGTVYDRYANEPAGTWRKISGPGTVVISEVYKNYVMAHGLEPGFHAFELSFTNRFGVKRADTMLVSTINFQKADVFFNDVKITCPWDCIGAINNLGATVPQGISLRVFVRPPGSNQDWTEIKSISQSSSNYKYAWQRNANSLWILSDNYGTVDVKVSFD